MKTQPRFLLISLALVSLLLVCVSILYLCKKEHTYKPHPIRPGNFPQILIAPAGAVSLDHSETSIPKQSPFAYTLTFIANDPYPSKDTCNFIETHLKSNGFQRLNYHLMNPDVPSEFPNVMLYQFYQKTGKLDESTKEKCRSPRPEGGNQPIRWMEDWLNKNNEHVCIDGGYIPLTDEEFPPAIEDKMDLSK